MNRQLRFVPIQGRLLLRPSQQLNQIILVLGSMAEKIHSIEMAAERLRFWAERSRRPRATPQGLTYVGSGIYTLSCEGERDKPLVWLHGEIKTPPMSEYARVETGYLLRRLQRGELLSLPESRPMPTIGARCHELRVSEAAAIWRVFYRIDPDAIVILEVLKKKTSQTPKATLDACRRRLAEYDRLG